MNTPLISIIIPTYNRAHLIGETLDSVLNQTYQNWECIIVDDGSTDNTAELVNAYVERDSRFQYHQRPESYKSGGNGARNYGFELSIGAFIQWFDDDDIMHVEFISERIMLFESDINFVIGLGSITDENLNIVKPMLFDSSKTLFAGFILWKNQIITNCVLFRKSFLTDKVLFDINIQRGQEAEFFSRLFFQIKENEYRIAKKPLFLYRQHENSKSEQNTAYLKHFKRSLSYICIENLKRSILIKDSELINVIHVVLLDYFFRGLENGDIKNCRYILKELFPLLNIINKRQALEFYIVGNLFRIISKGSYKIEKKWKDTIL
jgi:glycosyltransferase involved in cell wall biosynthesis